jgi:hypothetical protein
VTFKFWETLKNASEVPKSTLIKIEYLSTKKYLSFLKISNFVQSYVKYNVSLADGINDDITKKFKMMT